MDYLSAFSIAAAGMAVEKARVDLAAANLSHANAVLEPGKAGWRPARLVVNSGSFASVLGGVDTGMSLPRIRGVQQLDLPPRLEHQPGHPQADGQGYIRYANVNQLDETLTIMQATQAYKANLSAVSAARSMAQKALEIGGRR